MEPESEWSRCGSLQFSTTTFTVATNDNYRTKTNQTSSLQFSLIIVFPGDSHYHGCWTWAYSILRLLCFYGLCVSRFNAHINVCPGLSICAYSWTDFQPVAMIGPCVSLASGVSPYRQDFQGFPSVSWHWTSLFLSHMQTHTNTQTWKGLLTIQLHTNPVEGCRKYKLTPLPLSHMDHTVPCFLGDHSGSDGEGN